MFNDLYEVEDCRLETSHKEEKNIIIYVILNVYSYICSFKTDVFINIYKKKTVSIFPKHRTNLVN